MKKLIAGLLSALSIATVAIVAAPAPVGAVTISVACGSSIQTAYNSLPTPKGGVLLLDECRYDVGTGLVLDRNKPVSIIGPDRNRRHLAAVDVDDANRRPGAILWGSAVPSTGYLVATTTPNSSLNGQGFVFRNLTFDTDNAAGAILGDNINYTIVDNNFFAMGRADAWAIKAVTKDSFVQPGVIHGNDASWWRITDNNSRGGGFFCACGAEGGTTPPYNWNHNNFVIQGNVIFAPTTPTGPGIWLRGAHRSLIEGNNVEGKWNPAILLEGSYGNRLDGNGGEDGSASGQPGLVFVKLVNSDANFLSDMGTSTSQGQVLYHLDSASTDNIMIGSTLTNTRSLYGPNGVVNNGGTSNVIIGPGFTGGGGTGPAGPAGADGADGLSAYEIAVNNGFVGTEQEWLASLQGATGATGPAGIAGEPGGPGTVTITITCDGTTCTVNSP